MAAPYPGEQAACRCDINIVQNRTLIYAPANVSEPPDQQKQGGDNPFLLVLFFVLLTVLVPLLIIFFVAHKLSQIHLMLLVNPRKHIVHVPPFGYAPACENSVAKGGDSDGAGEVQNQSPSRTAQRQVGRQATKDLMLFPHWQFFESVDDDLYALSRIIEFERGNFATHSVALARLYLSVCSEIDVVAKLLCDRINPSAKPRNIDGYRDLITAAYKKFTALKIELPRHSIEFLPWKDCDSGTHPSWWTSYNKVKHHLPGASLRS